MTQTTSRISGAVIKTADGRDFDLISLTGKIEVSQEFVENLEKVFENEFVVAQVELIY